MECPDVLGYTLSEANGILDKSGYSTIIRKTFPQGISLSSDNNRPSIIWRVVQQIYVGENKIELVITPENWKEGDINAFSNNG